MRAGFDTSPLEQTRAGTARHVLGLLGELEGRPGLDVHRLRSRGRGKLATVRRDAVWYPLALGNASRSFDVLHCSTFRAPLRPRCPLVVTVHDLALERLPAVFPRWHRETGRRALRSAVRVADAVVAVSAFTRDELVELLAVPPERITIVPNGIEPVFSPEGPRAEGDYVLAVGTLEPRKNLAVALQAAELAGVELRVVGATGWGGVEVPGWVGEASDPELAALYRGARCLVFPSLYEGFGIPVLEAMACGTPVVTSDAGGTAEVAGTAAVLVDPLHPEAVAAGIAEAERDRDQLVERGLERAASFTWKASADLVEALWRELA
ncbi:MAG: glycosyltransferase family 1 protein [Gaiellales bacterium]